VPFGLWLCLGTDGQLGMTALPEKHAGDWDACIARAESDLIPATSQQINDAILAISAMPSNSGNTVDLKATMALYHIGFEDLPNDLLVEGVKAAIKASTRWRPMPGFVLQFVEEELAQRRLRLGRLVRSKP
jgi:hypothetical protein